MGTSPTAQRTPVHDAKDGDEFHIERVEDEGGIARIATGIRGVEVRIQDQQRLTLRLSNAVSKTLNLPRCVGARFVNMGPGEEPLIDIDGGDTMPLSSFAYQGVVVHIGDLPRDGGF